MHLSMLSESFLSDSLDDCGGRPGVAGREHRDGVLRGLLFFAALGLITFLLTGAATRWDADPATEPVPEHCAVAAAAAPPPLEQVRVRSQALGPLAEPTQRSPFDAN